MRTIEEIKSICEKERIEYEKRKQEYYSNPNHWSNNKRKYNGLPVLRGSVKKKFKNHVPPKFKSNIIFHLLEDFIEETVGNSFTSKEIFNQFVEVKDLKLGVQNEFYTKM